MKRGGFVLVAVAVVPIGVTLWAQSIKPPRAEKRVVTVAGNKSRTVTAFDLNRGDRVIVEASGTVSFSNGEAASAVGPSGYDRGSYAANWPYDAAACDDPVAAAGHAALLADVNGERVVVGVGAEFEGMEGLLYFGINDCTFTGDWNNTGAFKVTVKVARAPVPVPQEDKPKP